MLLIPLSLGVEIIETDWERSETATGRMIDGIGNRGSYSADYDLTHALRSDRIEPGIGHIDKVGHQYPDVSVYGYVILGDIRVEKTTEARIHLGGLTKTCAQAP